MLGFELDFWDYMTFLAGFVVAVLGIGGAVLVLGLPGRIAIARHHPEAEAVYLMGWVGFLAIVPWIQAFIWAFKPTNVVDIRYTEEEVRRETERQIAKLTGKPIPAEAAVSQNGPQPLPAETRKP